MKNNVVSIEVKPVEKDFVVLACIKSKKGFVIHTNKSFIIYSSEEYEVLTEIHAMCEIVDANVFKIATIISKVKLTASSKIDLKETNFIHYLLCIKVNSFRKTPKGYFGVDILSKMKVFIRGEVDLYENKLLLIETTVSDTTLFPLFILTECKTAQSFSEPNFKKGNSYG